ncbi:hypothetical protein GCM10022210_51900 [Mucilaginibacter dorajii]|uniref:Uncharacterized protein n=2 Tax=Mucilaginibacter dorajii TaxID=692994 RepID=A0ABP7R3C3_9SPHI
MILSAFTPQHANGQKRYFAVKPVEYLEDGRNLHFPVFYNNPANAATTSKINQQLQLSELELLKGFQTKNIFERINYNNGTIYGGKWQMTYDLFTNNNRLLSLGFDESSSGMTTAYWTRYYNFNAGNGDLIQLSDLFTPAGFKLFKSLAIKKSVRAFKEQIHAAGEPDSVWQDVIRYIGEYVTEDFYIKGNSIILNGDNRLSKNQKGWDMIVKFGLSSFGGYLNQYGRCVFGLTNQPIAQYRSVSLPQLFTGKIDKYPILFILRSSNYHDCEGVYCYQKYGRGISMQGDMVNGQIKLDEYDSDFNTKAHITGRASPDSVTGTWAKSPKGQSFRLLVYRK